MFIDFFYFFDDLCVKVVFGFFDVDWCYLLWIVEMLEI